MSDDLSGSITLEVVTPDALIVEIDVRSVSVSGSDGEFGVLPGHAPFLTKLRPGLVRYDEGGMLRTLCVSEGFVEVSGSRVIVLTRTCEKKEDIDTTRAEQAKLKAKEELAALADDSDGRSAIEARLARAETRIDYANDQLNFYG